MREAVIASTPETFARVTAASIVHAVDEGAARHPDRPILRLLDETGAEDTFDSARLRDVAARYMNMLSMAGVEPGDRILLLFPDNGPLVGAFLGALAKGAVPAIYPLADASRRGIHPPAIRRLVDSVGFRSVITPEAIAGSLHAVGCPVVGAAHQESAVGRTDVALRLPDPDEPAWIQLSSGTTGPPKGVVLSHRAVMAYAASVVRALRTPADGVSVGWLPLFHDMGLASHLLIPIAAGTRSVHIPTAHWLRHPETLFQAVHRYRGTMTWMPNFGFQYCARRVRDEDLQGLDLSSWRTVGNGAEPVAVEAMEAFAERFGPAGLRREALMVGYGFAENVCGATLTPTNTEPAVDWVSLRDLEEDDRAVPVRPRSPGSRAVMSCGPPRAGVEIRVVDAAGDLLPDRRVGRIQVRSTSLFSGYLGSDADDRAIDPDGWFPPGDLGYVVDGELYVCGRESDLMIVGGRNLHPEPLEAIAAAVLGPAGGRTAAFGVRDEVSSTEAPVLVCECKGSPDDPQREKLARRIRELALEETGVSLADVRLVARGWVVRTTSGKTARRASRRKYLEERSAESALEAGRDVVELVERRLGIRPIAPGDDLCALSDSLQLVTLVLELEKRMGREFPMETFLRDPRLAHLVEIVQRPDAAAPLPPRPAAVEGPAPESLAAAGLGGVRRLLVSAPVHAVGRRLIRLAERPRVARAMVRPKEQEALLRFYDLLDDPVPGPEEFLARAFAVRLHRRLLSGAPSTLPSGQPGWIRVSGRAGLRREWERGRGVILLHTHFGIPRIAGAAVPAGPGPERFTISMQGERVAQIGFADQLLAGRRALERGGIVEIAGDGPHGKSRTLVFPLHGRRREFRLGFAHLAEATDSPVLPVFSAIRPDGTVAIEIGDPLPADGESPDERVVCRVAAYVRLMGERWRVDPGNVPWAVMRLHCNLDALDSRPPSETVPER